MCTMLNIYFQVPISVLTPLNLKNKQCQLKKSLKRKNQSILILQSQVKWKVLYFLLVCVNENFKNQSLIDVQLIQELS